MKPEQLQDKLNTLLGTLNDGAAGYHEAAESAENSELKSMLSTIGTQRGELAAKVQAEIERRGFEAREGGSVGAALHRTWLNVRDAVTGRDDYAIIAECERGEDVAMANFKEVLEEENLPSDVREMVEGVFASVKESHDRMRDLKHKLQDIKGS